MTALLADHERVEQLVHWFETLTPASLTVIDRVYAEDAYFSDPFNRLQGRDKIRAVYQHMFSTLAIPTFKVETRMVQGQDVFLVWRFDFELRQKALSLHGSSHLQLDAAGRIRRHIDYWDAAEQVYERIPILGAVLRFIKRRMAL